MNALPDTEILTPESAEGAPEDQMLVQGAEQPQPEPVPETPPKPLAQARADLEKALAGFKAFVAELESAEGRLGRAEADEAEILEGGAALSEEEQLERLSRTLALKKVLERKLERGNGIGLQSAAGKLEGSVKEALRSLWHDLAALRSRREEKHLATLKKLVGDEAHWPWAIERAKTLMRHFGDLRAIDRLGDQADFSLSHGATQLAAEQALGDITSFEAERGAKR
jgi:hypothetical protein